MMGQKLVGPKEGSLACDLVLEREGEGAFKQRKKLAKVCGVDMHLGGRLQVDEWRTVFET